MTSGLDSLTELERETMRGYLAGESYREMSARLDRDEKAVDNPLNRTRRKLTERMAA